MQKLVINRSKWYRGNHAGSFLLRLEDGKMCCLGFLSKAVGLTDDEISNVSTPQGAINNRLFSEVPEGMKFLIQQGQEKYNSDLSVDNSYLCYRLMEANDASAFSDEERETILKRMFAENGWEVEFVD